MDQNLNVLGRFIGWEKTYKIKLYKLNMWEIQNNLSEKIWGLDVKTGV